MNRSESHAQRGTFHDSYIIPAGHRDRQNKPPRLLDCLLCVAQRDDPQYFFPCEESEFAVIDSVTKEKAWFELPAGASPEALTAMIEKAFALPALRVAPKLWVV